MALHFHESAACDLLEHFPTPKVFTARCCHEGGQRAEEESGSTHLEGDWSSYVKTMRIWEAEEEEGSVEAGLPTLPRMGRGLREPEFWVTGSLN